VEGCLKRMTKSKRKKKLSKKIIRGAKFRTRLVEESKENLGKLYIFIILQ
jgi:hypothetical protein